MKWLYRVGIPIVIVSAIVIAGHIFQPGYIKPLAIQQYPTAPIQNEVPVFQLSPTITEYGNELGINLVDLQAAHATIGDVSACDIGTTLAAGCTDGSTNDRYITIAPLGNRMANTYIQRDTLAYEYLHYVWEVKIDDNERNFLKPYLDSVVNNDSKLAQAINDPYYVTEKQRDPNSYYDELHSMVGSQVNDNYIPSILLDHYKQYLPNRDALPSYY